MSRVLDWLVAWLFRWLPRSTPTGLFAIGNPDEKSPVIVTGNFTLTVARLRKALRGRDVWLLVANSDGINVWCAADGGLFTHHRVIDAIKVSRLAERVTHRRILLPSLAASGVETEPIHEETGFRPRFGPVLARDIPAYLDARGKKTEAMRRYQFGLAHRLDMSTSMNFPIYLLGAAPLAIFWPDVLLGYTALFWAAVALLYLFVDWIPGKTGWSQALFCAGALAVGWAGFNWWQRGDPLAHGGWLLGATAVLFAVGFDLAGVATARRSDPERIIDRLGIKKLGSLFNEKSLGHISLDRDRCNGCRACFDVCPVGVWDDLDADKKIRYRDRDACFACSACVTQCQEKALALS
ncbi:MAG: 4Fe-4S dicluster domain-containing protein [bacterium]|nr:4Fe-4S dicluster domain-containing protein [bacterium]